MDATDHSPTQMPQVETPVIEPQRVAPRFVDVHKWVQEQDAAGQVEVAATAAASVEAKGSKKVTTISSQAEGDRDINSPATNSPAPTSATASTVSSPAISGAAASEILVDINWVGKLHGMIVDIDIRSACGE